MGACGCSSGAVHPPWRWTRIAASCGGLPLIHRHHEHRMCLPWLLLHPRTGKHAPCWFDAVPACLPDSWLDNGCCDAAWSCLSLPLPVNQRQLRQSRRSLLLSPAV